jgi:hypothetical protein
MLVNDNGHLAINFPCFQVLQARSAKLLAFLLLFVCVWVGG